MKKILVVLTSLMLSATAFAHDHGRTSPDWEELTPEMRAWYMNLRRPDMPDMPCCGLSDAYWCDTVYVRKQQMYCKITDTRPDKPLGRQHIPVGTEIEIPHEKLKYDQGNPTGHAVVFLSTSGFVFCFVQGTQT